MLPRCRQWTEQSASQECTPGNNVATKSAAYHVLDKLTVERVASAYAAWLQLESTAW